MARNRLKLSFVDSEGVCYHEAVLGPREAKILLGRSGVQTIRFSGTTFPLKYLTFADAKREGRAIVGKLTGPLGGEVIITPYGVD